MGFLRVHTIWVKALANPLDPEVWSRGCSAAHIDGLGHNKEGIGRA
jgi:hypothetical protein